MTVIVIRDAGDKARFDAVTEMWTVTTPDGRSDTARTVIDARRRDHDFISISWSVRLDRRGEGQV